MLSRLMDTLFTRKLEVVLVGLENSGKTTLLNVMASGVAVETVPTIGLNVKMIKKVRRRRRWPLRCRCCV